MSPGVATPCPAAPPIPIAKVCFITPSLAESRPKRKVPALGRAQIMVCNSVRETPPRDQLALPDSRSIHPILPHVLTIQRFNPTAQTRVSTGARSGRRPNRNDSSFEFRFLSRKKRGCRPYSVPSLGPTGPPKLSMPLPIWRLFLFLRKAHTLCHENEQAHKLRSANKSDSWW